mgnify:CR=1 FL=1
MILLWLLACVHVPAWDRSVLLSEPMDPGYDPLGQSFDLHVHDTREAMSGATAAAGVPCGCN